MNDRERLEKIASIMRRRDLWDDEMLSEIQDYVTMGGFDVPLRSYADHVTPRVPFDSIPVKVLHD